MPIGLALLVSTDPVTIRRFDHALQELFISTAVCHEVPAAIGLLNCRKFDAVIVDLQLGEESGLIFDEVHLSASERFKPPCSPRGWRSTPNCSIFVRLTHR
jgi:ActR/RegA family two-component response regulator